VNSRWMASVVARVQNVRQIGLGFLGPRLDLGFTLPDGLGGRVKRRLPEFGSRPQAGKSRSRSGQPPARVKLRRT
jgi:hypothetical protein